MVDLIRKTANENGGGELSGDAQTISGAKTFEDVVTLESGGKFGTDVAQDELLQYKTTELTFTTSGPVVATTTVYACKIGRLVCLFFRDLNTTLVAGTFFAFAPVLPAAYRPYNLLNRYRVPIYVVVNTVPQLGTVQISTGGTITIGVGSDVGVWPTGGTGGWSAFSTLYVAADQSG